jgi:arylsulfatase A-like enzyme
VLDGVNLLPALNGSAIERPEPLCWRWGGEVAYREGDWKLVTDEACANPELYNVATDPAETHDLAAAEVERLAGMLTRLRSHTAEIEAEGPDWWRSHDWNGPKRPRPAAAR